MNWKNLKLRSKLLISFIFISLILLVTGTLSIRTLKQTNQVKEELVMSYELADAIMESKYFLNHDVFILMEMLTSTELSEISAFWQEHKDDSEGLAREIGSIKTISEDKSWGIDYQSYKADIYDNARKIEADYKKHILPSFDKINSLRNQYIQLTKGSDSNDSSLVGQLNNLTIQINEIDEYADSYAVELAEQFNQMDKE